MISDAYLPSYLSYQLGAFITDRVHVTSRLTLDLGLRYDYFDPVEPRNNGADYSVFVPGTNSLIPLGQGENQYGNVPGHKLNFAPRIGLAYKIADHIVLRSGYGISYWAPIQYQASALIPTFTGVGNGVQDGGYGFVAVESL